MREPGSLIWELEKLEIELTMYDLILYTQVDRQPCMLQTDFPELQAKLAKIGSLCEAEALTIVIASTRESY